jgi:hypothetical protein
MADTHIVDVDWHPCPFIKHHHQQQQQHLVLVLVLVDIVQDSESEQY